MGTYSINGIIMLQLLPDVSCSLFATGRRSQSKQKNKKQACLLSSMHQISIACKAFCKTHCFRCINELANTDHLKKSTIPAPHASI